MKVIIYTNDQGGVSICTPSGNTPIETVLINDCPPGAMIIDESILPAQDNDFFNAWEWNGVSVDVNLVKARTYGMGLLTAKAKMEALHRATNNGAGIPNSTDDASWIAALNTARAAIGSAATTQAIRDATKPVDDIIKANA